MFPLLYHAHHTRHADDLPFWTGLAHQTGDPILELGCGTGRVLLPLAQAGWTVYGLDNDPEMLAFLQGQIPPTLEAKIQIFEADLADFHLTPRFRLIILPCNTYSTLQAESRQAMLACVRQHLLPGGLFAVSQPNPRIYKQLPAESQAEVEETFLVKINNVPLDGYISEKQEIINKAIKLSYQTFLDVIMLQQDKGNDLIIKDSSSDIFENIIFLKTINNIKKIFNDRKKDLIKEKDNLKLYKYYDIGNFTKEELETNKMTLEQKIQNINNNLKLEEEKYYNLNFSNQALLDEKVKIKENNILIEKKVSDSIVLCKRKISEIIAYYKEKSEKIKKFKGKCPACLKDLEGEDIQNLITFYKSKCDEDIKNIKENTRTNIQNLKSNIKIDNINNLDDIIKDINNVSNIIKQYKSELEPLNNELEIVIDKINKIVNNKDINIKINELQAEIDKCEKLYELFGDKNIPSILAQKIFPILENKINNYLAKFSTDMLTKFTVTNKGKRNIQIQYNGKYRPYTSFSGGQQVCINMAARISSADIISEMLGTNIDTLILDEPFPSLDDEVTESFMDVINQMSKKYSHIIIITHVDSLKSMFDKHLEIVMQEGKSLIRS